MFQFLEPGAPVGLFYSPGRDLAYCGLPYIGYAINEIAMQLEKEDTPIYKLMELFNVTKEELKDGLERFVKSLEEEVKSGIPDALKNNSFTPVKDEVRALIYFYVAPVFIGSAIRGYKDAHSEAVVKEMDEKTFREKALKYIVSFGFKDETQR